MNYFLSIFNVSCIYSKIRCDGTKSKNLEFWRHLNKWNSARSNCKQHYRKLAVYIHSTFQVPTVLRWLYTVQPNTMLLPLDHNEKGSSSLLKRGEKLFSFAVRELARIPWTAWGRKRKRLPNQTKMLGLARRVVIRPYRVWVSLKTVNLKKQTCFGDSWF
jgi:hypothetical protein